MLKHLEHARQIRKSILRKAVQEPDSFSFLEKSLWQTFDAQFLAPDFGPLPDQRLNEVGGIELAVYNRTVLKAEKVAQKFLGSMETGRFASQATISWISSLKSTLTLTGSPCSQIQVPVICQPMAPNLETAEQMVAACRCRDPFFIHENFRWQTPSGGEGCPAER
jgi:hypothetical protein